MPYVIAELSFNGVVKFKVTLVKVSTSTTVNSTLVELLHKKSMKDWNLQQIFELSLVSLKRRWEAKLKKQQHKLCQEEESIAEGAKPNFLIPFGLAAPSV